ncbi:MAG: LysR substrate-binding domain-containing protein [Paracoccus sp. (in: a-proteobacteria)]|uniref:LysR family transcriptional regulator n=1 Tax=Paracoccus sp. TaxID=267 RepID=UPI0032426021
MELKWLEDFVTLASTGSFSRAAELRNVTQSAFSRRIKQLEIWLGADLVSRATIPAELTAQGEEFLPVAQDAIRTMMAARVLRRPGEGQARAVLNIAALQTLTVTLLPKWLERLHQLHPTMCTSVIPDRGGIELNLENLITGEADLLFTYSHPFVPMMLDPRQFDWVTLDRDRIMPVMSPDLRDGIDIAGVRRVFSGKGEKALPYLDYGNASFFGKALERLFLRNPLSRRVTHQNAMCLGLRRLALDGHGICWLPESLVAEDLSQGRLLCASADARWHVPLDIRLYRCKSPEHSSACPDDLWRKLGQPLSDDP